MFFKNLVLKNLGVKASGWEEFFITDELGELGRLLEGAIPTHQTLGSCPYRLGPTLEALTEFPEPVDL